MSIEALWAIEFTGVHGVRAATSGGVIVVESSRVFGGDSWQWYTGKYERDQNSNVLKCQITTGVHHTAGGQSIFGGPLQAMRMAGTLQVASDQQTMQARLTVEGHPEMVLQATLTRVAELP
jgi:hypothetical protein